ncbi:MAG TPA: 3-oxoacyl-[acyl-carrier-protein] synthase III C-terminal domain-containing protein [Pyrinomonadaceae bacterium]|nr:3-oxoacyl-[acyl-carrier-protein] synthase III C-terminal domain-containing protein [Pyrinomonadaceae bacterium]
MSGGLFPHQANANLLAQVARGIGLTNYDKVISVIEHTGNASSASMGLASDHLLREREVKESNQRLLLVLHGERLYAGRFSQE